MQANPENVAQQNLKIVLEETIREYLELIAETDASFHETTLPAQSVAVTPIEEKWSKEKHPAFQAGYKRPGAAPEAAEEPEAAVVYKVNDMVSARWVSGDKAWYNGRIISITGSSAAPVYTVLFKQYNNHSENLSGNDLKPISSESKKRKADAYPTTTASTVTVPRNANVISAAANINEELASQARTEPSKTGDGHARPGKIARKVKATKELEAGKTKWQDFNAKGKMSKLPKKDSMFRTGDTVGARGTFCATSSSF